LFHTAIIAIVRDFLGSNSTLLMIVLTLALSFVVNYFVEEPLEHYRQRRASLRKPTDSLAVGADSATGDARQVVDPGQTPAT
jgi:peptidoglycan/LPS O-acetylase OafA/YrhL